MIQTHLHRVQRVHVQRSICCHTHNICRFLLRFHCQWKGWGWIFHTWYCVACVCLLRHHVVIEEKYCGLSLWFCQRFPPIVFSFFFWIEQDELFPLWLRSVTLFLCVWGQKERGRERPGVCLCKIIYMCVDVNCLERCADKYRSARLITFVELLLNSESWESTAGHNNVATTWWIQNSALSGPLVNLPQS